jgi:predicted dehydrogenase
MNEPISRRTFLDGAAKAGVALAATPRLAASAVAAGKLRVALVGTGHRGTGMWGADVVREFGDRVEFTGLCDINPQRVEAGRRIIGVACPTFTDFERMVKETRPDTVIVTTKDAAHDEQIVRALELGCDVITEKPMTTDEHKCRRILNAEKKSGKQITVAFNYRYSAIAEKIKEILSSGIIGPVTNVDFHWYLDTRHGADYFRRWHAYRENSGTLFVHKATHHFDLVNWYLEADPVEVFAHGELRHYGRNGKLRGQNCRSCAHKTACNFYRDISGDARLKALYVDCEGADGYQRDACVFREDINIYDTMTAQVKYANGAMLSYSLTTFAPYEGYHLSFAGLRGRLDARCYEDQPWEAFEGAEIRVSRNFGKSELSRLRVPQAQHFGADPRLKKMIFHPDQPDPLGQRAGSRAGALSLLTGVAAVRSVERRAAVRIAELIRLD